MKTLSLLLIILLMSGSLMHLDAQNDPPGLTKDKQESVVDGISQLLLDNYIFPEKAKEMADFIKGKLTNNHYHSIADPLQFSMQLTDDLQSISHDKHINVRFDPQMVSEIMMSNSPEDSVHIIEIMDDREARENFGFSEAKILSDGVGYLKLTGFSGSAAAGEAAAATMNFLSRSEALIIDLRQNGGGSPDMIQILTSYLFGPGSRVHLNDFYYRPADQTEQRWTLPYVPGKRMPDVDVYVLTSNRTFSAAEEFTYNLKNLKRATIIGETTGGGAHPGDFLPISDEFAIFVPNGRAINPITHTNWEGTGVEPDIKTSADQALPEAHYLAVRKLAEKYPQSPENPYTWTKDQLKAIAHPLPLELDKLREYAGNFGPRKISLEANKLFYQRDAGPLYELQPMAEDLFMIPDIPYFRLRFVRENGEIIAVEGIYNNGRRDKNMKISTP